MAKKYNTRQIKDDYSYYVEQVADLFGVDIATVRRWIRKEGLKRIPKTRPHMVHSSDLKAFLEKRQKDRRKPCAGHEALCCRCQLPRTPTMGSGTIEQLTNGSIRYRARCSCCNGKMVRTISRADWSENHPLAAYLYDASGEHKGVQATHRECSLRQEGNP